MFLCTFFALSGAIVFTLGKARWGEIDHQDPGKVLAQEVLRTLRVRMPWAASNGSHFHAGVDRSGTDLLHGDSIKEDK